MISKIKLFLLRKRKEQEAKRAVKIHSSKEDFPFLGRFPRTGSKGGRLIVRACGGFIFSLKDKFQTSSK